MFKYARIVTESSNTKYWIKILANNLVISDSNIMLVEAFAFQPPSNDSPYWIRGGGFDLSKMKFFQEVKYRNLPSSLKIKDKK